MRFTCPSCSKAYRLSRDCLGASGQARIRCPNCSKVVRVRGGEGDELICELSTSGAHQPVQTGRKRAATRPKKARRAGPTTGRKPALATKPADPAVWHVAVNRKAQGPLNLAKVRELIASGAIGGKSLAWRKGQTGWKKIAELPELARLMEAAPASAPARPPRKTEPASAAARRGPKPDAAAARASAPARPKAPGRPIAATVKSASALADGMLDDDAPTMAVAVAQPSKKAAAPNAAADASTKPNRRPLIDQLNKGKVKPPDGAEAPREQFDDNSPTVEQDIAVLVGDGAPASKLGARKASAPDMSKPKARAGTKTGRRGRRRKGTDGSADLAAASPKKKRKRKKKKRRSKSEPKPAPVAARQAPDQTEKTAPPDATSKNRLPPKPVRAAKSVGKTAPEPAAAASATNMQAAAQSANFFETGETFMADVDLTLPDSNKHKPTKEEYNSLLQEFSVMFRLDKRTKRQKWVIGGVLAGLLIGVIAFGVILVVQGDKRHRLIRDSKTILAVFSLPYQTSVTVRMGGDDDEDESPGAEKTGVTRSTSVLANRLRRKIQKKRVASVKMRRDGKVALTGGKGPRYIQPSKLNKLSKAEILAQKKAAERALRDALKRSEMGGRQERVVVRANTKTDVTKGALRKLCSNNMEKLYRCAQKYAGGADYLAVLSITDAGRVGSVKAMIQGSRNGALSSCALATLKRVNFGLQNKARTHRCQVGG